MLCPYYHFDPTRSWPADILIDELRAYGIRAKRNGDNLELQIQIDRLLPASYRLWRWFQHVYLRKWDVFITFNKSRFLRNVEIEVKQTFSEEFEAYVAKSVDTSLRKIGCIELLSDEDEFEIAKQIGGLSPEIESAVDTLRASISAVDQHRRPLDFQELSQRLKHEDNARSHLDALLFGQIGSEA